VSRLTELIGQAKQYDAQLGADLAREFKALSDRRAYGLNFERHRPEAVELPQRAPRKGDKVRVLPVRGSADPGDQRLWRVIKVEAAEGVHVAHIQLLNGPQQDRQVVAVDDLVVVAEFQDVIYPGLVSTGKVERSADKPFHTVINGENYHVLKTLTYTHRGKIDVIYIDPPYNTRDKDWKYNNDYVDSDDLYRHSKWLAFMERRLWLTKNLLKPEDSVLIVTINECEVHRLGLLLEQVFPEANIQMVTSYVKPSGSQRSDEFSRVEEYLFFVMFGAAQPASSRSDMLRHGPDGTAMTNVTWHGLRRRGSTDWRRSDRPNGFYPIFVERESGLIHSVGDSLTPDADRETVIPPDGTFAAWPLDPQGREGRWQISPSRLRKQLADGTAALRSADPESGSASIAYLKSGDLRLIREGYFKIEGREDDGRVKVIPADVAARRPKTMWVMDSHDASAYGTALLSRFISERKFPFPKSLYAVEDALRFFVKDKPGAVILDFFAGSGTTAHSVIRLNEQDDGRRQCILVTNNEVSADEQDALRKKGLRPGDSGWEQYGICEYITKPRIEAAITGKTPDGEPVEGEYKFIDEFPMDEGFEENGMFFTLTYESPIMIGHNKAFTRIAPLLWLRAGSQGQCITSIPDNGWAVADTYGILFDLDRTTLFCQAIGKSGSLRLAYIVTDDDRRFQAVTRHLPDSVEPVRLYESYLANFRFVNGD
jgi:adenine-specific DNA-methyltransferase